MTDPLRRINRAKKHLNVLNREVKGFIASQPYRISINKDPKDGSYIIRPYLIKQYPVSWGFLIGEVVHGLRSALDNIAWVLAIRQDRTISFPIFIDRNDKFVNRLECLREDVRSDVEAVQPYNAPNGQERMHPLWILHITDIIDKHRIILPGATRVSVATGLPSPRKYLYIDGFKRLNKGTVEFRLTIPPDLKKNFKPEVAAQIGFNISSPIPSEADNPPRLRLRDLFVIHHFVRNDVYPRFAKFLEPENRLN